LLTSLTAAADARLILVDAPIGYGKTTLLAQWAASTAEPRPFAWVTLDAADDHPIRLWTYIAEALRRVEPELGNRVMEALAARPDRLTEVVVPLLLKDLAVLPHKLVIVLDDYHQIRNESCHESIGLLIREAPRTTQIVIATRSDPPFTLSPWDSSKMIEVRASELQFNLAEADLLLRETLDREPVPSHVKLLVDRTEGWPAGFYLAALSLQVNPEPERFVEHFAGDNRHVADYLTLEILSKQPKWLRRFLLRTSILDRFTAPLCDAVVGVGGSKQTLEHLEHSNLFLISLDDEGKWYRYHGLFQDFLRAELWRSHQNDVSDLHRRASSWHRKLGFLEEAIAHAIAAADLPSIRELVGASWFPYWEAGHLAIVRSWLDALGERNLEKDEVLALVAAWAAGLSGRTHEFEHWLAIADGGSFDGMLPDGASSLQAGVALSRSLFRDTELAPGLDAARHAAELEEESESHWRQLALVTWGYYLYLSGDPRGAVDQLEEVDLASSGEGASVTFARALLAMIALEQGRRAEAEGFARSANALADDMDLEDDPTAFAAHLAQGLLLAEKNEFHAAQRELERALELGRLLPWLRPWPVLHGLLALAPVRMAQGNRKEASTLLLEAERILNAHPDAGVLADRVTQLEADLDAAARSALGEPLTERELAVLQLLPSRSTQRVIGQRLHLSINTVKSHNRSIYRKLGVESREHAVRRGNELGLINSTVQVSSRPANGDLSFQL